MNEISAENRQKYYNYTEQFKRLKKALDNEFYFEAIAIEYSVIEDRTESVLRHAGLWEAYLKSKCSHKRQPNLESKIKYIQCHAAQKKTKLNKYFGDELLNDILKWKEDRNRLIHALLKQDLTTEEFREIAICGYENVKILRNRATSFRNSVNREKRIDE